MLYRYSNYYIYSTIAEWQYSFTLILHVHLSKSKTSRNTHSYSHNHKCSYCTVNNRGIITIPRHYVHSLIS